MFWADDDLDELRGTGVDDEARRYRAETRDEFRPFRKLVRDRPRIFPERLRDALDFELYLWAAMGG